MQEEFTLCYRTSFSQNWNCECGFDSVRSIDERAIELKVYNNNYITTFFPHYSITPTFLKQQYVRYKLIPTFEFTTHRT